MTTNKTQVIKNLKEKSILVSREFNAPIDWFGEHLQKVNYQRNGGLLNLGEQKQSR